LDRHALESLPHHARASYTLERGVWTATCRICGYTTRDVSRGRAAGAFLVHIRAGRQLANQAGSSAGAHALDALLVVDADDPAKLVAPAPEVTVHAMDSTYQGGRPRAKTDSEG
jgi:hypothetical protein